MLGEPDERDLAAAADLALARLAFDTGDERHGAEHIATAIATAPTLPEVHEALARLAARDDGGLGLFPLDGPAFVGAVVARAHLLAAAGRPVDGIRLLAACTAHAPTVDWAGVPWIQAADLPRTIEPGDLAGIFAQLCSQLPDPVAAAVRPPLRPYLRLARHAVRAYPSNALLLGAASALARRLGETALAVRWAEAGLLAAPSRDGEMWLGCALRSAGRIDDALAALRRAVEHDPSDLALYTDIAEMLAQAGRLDEALAWAQRALDRDPTFDCAVHVTHRVRYRQDGRIAHLLALSDFQRSHPGDIHEHRDLAQCCADRPWLGRLPRAGEVGIAVLDELVRAAQPVHDASLRLTTLEPPSAMRTLAAALPHLRVTVHEVPEPDIRRPRRGAASMLWRYDDTAARPDVPAPSAPAVECLLHVAQPDWPHPAAAYDRAAPLSAVTCDDLLGLLAHPPHPPSGPAAAYAAADPAQWVRSVQVWTCLGLLHHRADQPWPESIRRRVLVDLAWDVEDWITEAALFALVAAAWTDPAVRADVAALVAERIDDATMVARQRPVTIGWSLGQLATVTPALGPLARQHAAELLGVPVARTRPTQARRRLAILSPGRPLRQRASGRSSRGVDVDELAAVTAGASGVGGSAARGPEPAGSGRTGRLVRWLIGGRRWPAARRRRP